MKLPKNTIFNWGSPLSRKFLKKVREDNISPLFLELDDVFYEVEIITETTLNIVDTGKILRVERGVLIFGDPL